MTLDLITLEEYKDSQGITSPKDDTVLSDLITSVSQLVKTYCENSFLDYYSTPKVETINLTWHATSIQLAEYPVKEIISVEERQSQLEGYKTLTEEAGEYYFDPAIDSVFRTTGGSQFKNWTRGPGSVRITYTAGYNETPMDLKLAVISLVTYYYKDEYKPNRSMAGASIINASSDRGDNFPAHIRRVLDMYKG